MERNSMENENEQPDGSQHDEFDEVQGGHEFETLHRLKRTPNLQLHGSRNQHDPTVEWSPPRHVPPRPSIQVRGPPPRYINGYHQGYPTSLPVNIVRARQARTDFDNLESRRPVIDRRKSPKSRRRSRRETHLPEDERSWPSPFTPLSTLTTSLHRPGPKLANVAMTERSARYHTDRTRHEKSDADYLGNKYQEAMGYSRRAHAREIRQRGLSPDEEAPISSLRRLSSPVPGLRPYPYATRLEDQRKSLPKIEPPLLARLPAKVATPVSSSASEDATVGMDKDYTSPKSDDVPSSLDGRRLSQRIIVPQTHQGIELKRSNSGATPATHRPKISSLSHPTGDGLATGVNISNEPEANHNGGAQRPLVLNHGRTSWGGTPQRSLSIATSLPRNRFSISAGSSVGILGDKAYIYQELRENEIRLVKLLPARMATIRCEIIHVDIDAVPDYVALSYAWGDVADTKKIEIEGRSIPITASLHGGLYALRLKSEPLLVWADALCIDQQNRDERTEQVKMMTEIYSLAKSVAIWLGPEADDSSRALEFLSDLQRVVDDPAGVSELIAKSVNGSEISAAVALFERDYWRRLWVVQEVLNAREITVYCGAVSMHWDVCIGASQIFKRHRRDLDKYFPGGSGNEKQNLVSQSQLTYSQVLIHQGPGSFMSLKSVLQLGEVSLLEVLKSCRRKLAVDPKDKVFGILGILPHHVREDFYVDYSLSVKEVYTRIVDYLLHTTERLDVICEAIYFPIYTSSISLPTWVPDWSHIAQTGALGLTYDFHTSRDTKASFRFLDDQRNKLEISAIKLDIIDRHGIAVGTLCTLADYLMAFLHWRALLLGSEDVLGRVDRYRLKAFAETLCLEQIPERWASTWPKVLHHLFAYLLRSRLPHFPLDNGLASSAQLDLGLEPGSYRAMLHQYVGTRMIGRCFCITREGRLGMGTGFMSPGDLVVVPLGCSTPILLRPEGTKEEYRLVGDIYVHGFMNGLIIDELNEGRRKVEKFVLH